MKISGKQSLEQPHRPKVNLVLILKCGEAVTRPGRRGGLMVYFLEIFVLLAVEGDEDEKHRRERQEG